MIGGTGLIKCSKEDFEKLKKKVSAHYYKKSLVGINFTATYDDELEGVIFEYESNLFDFWDRENRQELLDQIEDWFALGEVIEMNEWWVDKSYKDKIDLAKCGLLGWIYLDTEVQEQEERVKSGVKVVSEE